MAASGVAAGSGAGFDVAILGGGQLGRMMLEAAHRIGVTARVLDPAGPASPAGQVCEGAGVVGSFRDPAAVAALATHATVVTVEIEHVDCVSLAELEAVGQNVQPSAATIALIQDKYAQKCHLDAAGIPVGPFMDTPSLAAAHSAGEKFGYPFMLKAKRMAYDGRGNAIVASGDAVAAAFAALGGDAGNELYAEQWVAFGKELAVMVARSTSGEVRPYPVVETEQRDNVCHTVLAPAQEPADVLQAADDVACAAVASLAGAGVFGVEMFLCADGAVLLNEIAPRPHNSGHYTMEACETDQFEQHLRCVLGLPLGSCAMRVGAAAMVNFLGAGDGADSLAAMQACLAVPGAGVHWYGKGETRKGRKMGHVTVVAPDAAALEARLQLLEAATGMALTLRPVRVPVVGIIMGSDSDLPCMQEAAAILDVLAVPYELTVVSAHRTPDRMYTYARGAAGRGIRVVIAGAGGAAHLPGMVAALTPLPVIGVPVKTSALSGVDSLYSIVQMPRGIPVATVAIGNAKNAGLLAARMLAASDGALQGRLVAWQTEQENEVLDKAAHLEAKGYKAYLDTM